MGKKLTIADILERKKVIKPLELKFYSETLGGEIDIKKISPDKIFELAQDIQTNRYTAFCKVIYASCPIFQSRELHEQFKPVEPFEIVDIVFGTNLAEISILANQIFTLYGMGQPVDVNEVKK